MKRKRSIPRTEDAPPRVRIGTRTCDVTLIRHADKDFQHWAVVHFCWYFSACAPREYASTWAESSRRVRQAAVAAMRVKFVSANKRCWIVSLGANDGLLWWPDDGPRWPNVWQGQSHWLEGALSEVLPCVPDAHFRHACDAINGGPETPQLRLAMGA